MNKKPSTLCILSCGWRAAEAELKVNVMFQRLL